MKKTFYDIASIKKPILLIEWSKENTILPKDVSYKSHKKVWWICSKCNYHWQASIAKRWTTGCPRDAGKVLTIENSLQVKFPNIASDFHPTKNNLIKLEELFASSNKKIWWICKTCKNEWNATVNNRTNKKTTCPYCMNRKTNNQNNLAVQHPKLIKEWHPTKNSLTPLDIVPGSQKKYWWICSVCHHEWLTQVNIRIKSSCPACSGHAVSDKNRLTIKYPHIIKEWHPKNKNTPNPSLSSES